MKKESGIQARILLVFMLTGLIMPVYANADDAIARAVPLWSDALGTYQVLIDCSDDGLWVIAGSDTGLLKMYDTGGRTLWTRQVDRGAITSVSISGNGTIISATAGETPENGRIVMFNRNGDLLLTFPTNASINRAAVSRNGRHVVASANGNIHVFDSQGDLIGSDNGTGVIWNVAISGDGRYGIAAVDYGWEERTGAARIVDMDTGVAVEYPMTERSAGTAVSGDGDFIAGISDHKVYSLFLNGTLRWSYASSPPFSAIAVSSDGRSVAAGSQYYLSLFTGSGDLIWKYPDTGYFRSVALSDSGDITIAGSSDYVRLFSRSGIVLWEYYTGTPSRVSMAGDGTCIAVGTDREILFFNREGTGVRSVETGTTGTVTTPSARTTSINPGVGGAPVEQLTNIHPTVKGNAAIMQYIAECGVAAWHEEQMGAEFKSVHIFPADSCGKQLVYSERKSGDRDDATRITAIWIIGVNDTWSADQEPVRHSGYGSQAQGQPAGAPGFAAGGAVAAVALGVGIIVILQRRK